MIKKSNIEHAARFLQEIHVSEIRADILRTVAKEGFRIDESRLHRKRDTAQTQQELRALYNERILDQHGSTVLLGPVGKATQSLITGLLVDLHGVNEPHHNLLALYSNLPAEVTSNWLPQPRSFCSSSIDSQSNRSPFDNILIIQSDVDYIYDIYNHHVEKDIEDSVYEILGVEGDWTSKRNTLGENIVISDDMMTEIETEKHDFAISRKATIVNEEIPYNVTVTPRSVLIYTTNSYSISVAIGTEESLDIKLASTVFIETRSEASRDYFKNEIYERLIEK